MNLLNVEDFEDTKLDPDWSPFDYLLEVARVAQEKLRKGKEKMSHDCGFLNCFLCDAPQPHAMRKEVDMSFKQGKSLSKNAAELKRKRKLQEDDEECEGLKLKRNKKETPVCPNPPPDLPDNFKQHIVEMGGSDWVLVIQKAIYSSDVKRQASRFSMPFSQLKTLEFLTKTEVEFLEDDNAIQVCLLEPSLKETDITFKRWNMNTSSTYVLRSTWNSVVENNGLKKHDIVQLWSFRVKSRLCFALVKLEVQTRLEE